MIRGQQRFTLKFERKWPAMCEAPRRITGTRDNADDGIAPLLCATAATLRIVFQYPH
jgi:hypothetical protein